MELILVRHLPTEWNQNDILQGTNDIPIVPLSKFDELDVQKNQEDIKRFQPELVLTSGLIRTQQTAYQYGYESVKVEPLLNELDFGVYEGKEKKHLLAVKDWTENPRALKLGERMIDFEERLNSFLKEYKKYSRILVFGHGSWMRGMVSIERVGNIQEMNKIKINNNELIYLKFP